MKTWLPIFPGFYETNFDMREVDIDELLSDDEYNKLMKNNKYLKKFWNYFFYQHYTDIVNENTKDYRDDIAEQCCHKIADELTDILKMKVNIQFENICSPRYYNFTNDSINCNIEVENETEFINKVIELLKAKKDEFEDYILDNYTSYDGFLSYYSNDVEDWLNKKDFGEHELGALLEALLMINGYNMEFLYDDIEDRSYEFVELSNAFKLAIGSFNIIINEVIQLGKQYDDYVDLMKPSDKVRLQMENCMDKNYQELSDDVMKIVNS